MTDQTTVADMMAEARERVPEITAKAAKEGIEAGEIDLVLDVREPNEWAEGRIPGAVHAPRGLLEFFIDPQSPVARQDLVDKREASIVVHCASGGRSLLAADTMRRMGFQDVRNMAGGYKDWIACGFETESE